VDKEGGDSQEGEEGIVQPQHYLPEVRRRGLERRNSEGAKDEDWEYRHPHGEASLHFIFVKTTS